MPERAQQPAGKPIWVQRTIELRPVSRGFHLITDHVERAVPELTQIRRGLANIFICHTSASLTLNENASRDVLRDFATYFDRAVPENAQYWTHTLEGSDDMPAHVKAALLGSSVSVPISAGALALGTWQGVYLGEHRDSGGARRLTITAWGEGLPPGT
ncbi:MAG: secondary thiamine-phosphate synthase enzyme YjbQ [Thermoleophilaceae bacterium]